MSRHVAFVTQNVTQVTAAAGERSYLDRACPVPGGATDPAAAETCRICKPVTHRNQS